MAGIDINALAKKFVPMAFTLAGTAKKTAVLHLSKTRTFSNANDAMVESGGQDVTVEGIAYRTQQQQKTDITGNTQMFLVEVDKLPVAIKEVDNLTIDGVLWQIVTPEFDPTNTIAMLTLRR